MRAEAAPVTRAPEHEDGPMPNRQPMHLIPLTIAVAGHRHIGQRHAHEIAQHIRVKFKELKNRYRSTPFRCLSSLSTTADMLFTEVALALDLEVVAVLSAPSQAFAESLRKEEQDPQAGVEKKRKFLSLVSKCTDIIVLGQEVTLGNRPRTAAVGRYLARHSHLLFALWDNKHNAEEGSTGHIVSLFKNGCHDDRQKGAGGSVLDCPEPQGMRHLLMESQEGGALRPAGWESTDPKDSEEKALARRLSALDRFNKQARRMASDEPTLFRHAVGALSLPRLPEEPHTQRLIGAFAIADQLAVKFRDQTWRTLQVVFISAMSMLVSFALYSNINAHPLLLGLYIAGFAAGCDALLFEYLVQSHNQFLDYRVLAEALRIQVFFRLAGVEAMISDKYLGKFRAEVAWIRDALRCLNSALPSLEVDQELVKRCWIDEQNKYYSSRSRKEKTVYAVMEDCSKIFFFSGLGLAVFLLVATLRCGEIVIGPDLKKWIVLLIGFLPAFAAILAGYVYRRGLEAHTKEYERMQPIFQRAAELVGAMNLPQDAADFREVVTELGLEALAENGDWLLLHRGRPIPIPQ